MQKRQENQSSKVAILLGPSSFGLTPGCSVTFLMSFNATRCNKCPLTRSSTEKQKIPKTHAFCYDLPVRYWPSLMTSNAALSILSEVSKIRRTMQMLSKIPFDLSFYVVHLVFGYHDFDWFSTRIRTYLLNQDLSNQNRIIKSLSCVVDDYIELIGVQIIWSNKVRRALLHNSA